VTDVQPGERGKEKRKQVGKDENGGGGKQKNPSRSKQMCCPAEGRLVFLSLSQAAVAQRARCTCGSMQTG